MTAPLQNIAQVLGLIGIVPVMRIKVQAAAGSSIVIEPRGGRLVVHDNPTRVLTNTPTLDWHLTNLNNDVTLMQAYPATKAAAPVSVQRPWLRS